MGLGRASVIDALVYTYTVNKGLCSRKLKKPPGRGRA